MTDGVRHMSGPATRSRPSRSDAGRCGDAAACRAFVVDGMGAADGPDRLRSTTRPVDQPRRRGWRGALELPCRRHDPELWFAEAPADLERAKELCVECPIRMACLAVAVDRAEYTGVWGGHIFDRGRIVPRKRPRGRPRKHDSNHVAGTTQETPSQEHDMITSIASVPGHDLDRMHAAALRLYDAECAVHVAHQTRVDTWINAANQRLHEAVTEYLAAAAENPAELHRRQSAS